MVDEAGEEDGENDAGVHHDGEDHGAEAPDGLEDEDLADGVADGEDDHVHVHFGVAHLGKSPHHAPSTNAQHKTTSARSC